MKKRLVTLLLGILGMTAFVQAQIVPDPRDSIILESKTVHPGANTGGPTDTAAYAYMKVYFTNKDSLTFFQLVLRERTTTGGAYMTLGYPRSVPFDGVMNFLTNTLRYNRVANLSTFNYNDSSPDSFLVAAGFDAAGDPYGTIEPPNAVRKAIFEFKFDAVLDTIVGGGTGIIEFDTCRLVGSTGLTNTVPRDVKVNFLKSEVRVVFKGDLNLDDVVSPADVVLELMCVFMGNVPPAGRNACDVNCDGNVFPSDVVAFLAYKFLTLMWPC